MSSTSRSAGTISGHYTGKLTNRLDIEGRFIEGICSWSRSRHQTGRICFSAGRKSRSLVASLLGMTTLCAWKSPLPDDVGMTHDLHTSRSFDSFARERVEAERSE